MTFNSGPPTVEEHILFSTHRGPSWQRTDEYGGSKENRTRFLLEVIAMHVRDPASTVGGPELKVKLPFSDSA
ncbi:hypothetical protein AB1L30_00530 [Bremerella sp. JC817]|uniref:oxidoreductase n=1 Tax=Bremerella sp. JC817 TaxID=3231756 RepID=UPI0034586059